MRYHEDLRKVSKSKKKIPATHVGRGLYLRRPTLRVCARRKA